jgi:cyclopropane fatty-acyl-phospholipid synthase-like methyltransferase
MNWKEFWDRQARNNSDPQAQVGRIRSGRALPEATVVKIVDHIVEQLDLQQEDHLLDLCCGNGLLTRQLAWHCQRALGLDLSESQLAMARQRGGPNHLTYACADAVALDAFFESHAPQDQFDKINLYFSFQYLDTFQKGKQAIAGMLNRLRAGGRIFIGDVPDQQFFSSFYPTPQARLNYFLKSKLGKNDMGKFWSASEMQRIGKELGIKVIRKVQPEFLPYASYRVDYLLHR